MTAPKKKRPTKTEREPITPAEFWYRYEAIRYSNGVDQFDNSLGSHLKVVRQTFRVRYKTPKGVRLTNGTFVLNQGKKKAAHATQAEAREAFVRRKERYIEILNGKIGEAESALFMISHMQDQPDPKPDIFNYFS